MTPYWVEATLPPCPAGDSRVERIGGACYDYHAAVRRADAHPTYAEVVRGRFGPVAYKNGKPRPLPPPASVFDARVPQPGRMAGYGVPPWLFEPVRALYDARNRVPDADVAAIDAAILRLLEPYTRPA